MATTNGPSCVRFTEFLETVRRETDELGVKWHERPWYRGHNNAGHSLLPSLFRPSTLAAIQSEGAAGVERDEVLRLESDLFFEFQMRIKPGDLNGHSAWDLLFLMRHYGLPTRTLDWSETLGVAIYFALSGDGPPPSPTIWVLNPYALNEMTTGWDARDTVLPKYLAAPFVDDPEMDYDDMLGYGRHGAFKFQSPVAVCPGRSNERMQAQAGSFTVHGNNWDPIEKQVPPSVVRAIPIPHDAIEGARQFLRDGGLTTRVLFPGLEGLAREMLERFPRSAAPQPGATPPSMPRR